LDFTNTIWTAAETALPLLNPRGGMVGALAVRLSETGARRDDSVVDTPQLTTRSTSLPSHGEWPTPHRPTRSISLLSSAAEWPPFLSEIDAPLSLNALKDTCGGEARTPSAAVVQDPGDSIVNSLEQVANKTKVVLDLVEETDQVRVVPSS
jgi:hypothetical protein